ncbi:MAG: radical SAM protein [Nanobdellota archaeon]
MRKIFLVTDYACDNSCISCAKKSDERGKLNLDEIKSKIDWIKPCNNDNIEISGGEPSLRDDIFDMISYIKSNYDTNVTLLSNGRKFKDSSFSKSMKESGIDRVMTTFYNADERKHDSITQRKGSFQDTLKGLHNLQDIEVPLSVKTIITQNNYKELTDFVNFAYDEFPEAWVSLHGLIMRGNAFDNREQLVVKYSDMKPYVEDALDTAIERNKNLGVFVTPTCILDPMYWSYLSVDWKQMTQEMIYISPEETVQGNMDVEQPQYCNECVINENCSWAWESAWKEYIDMFGTKELHKITPQQLYFRK